MPSIRVVEFNDQHSSNVAGFKAAAHTERVTLPSVVPCKWQSLMEPRQTPLPHPHPPWRMAVREGGHTPSLFGHFHVRGSIFTFRVVCYEIELDCGEYACGGHLAALCLLGPSLKPLSRYVMGWHWLNSVDTWYEVDVFQCFLYNEFQQPFASICSPRFPFQMSSTLPGTLFSGGFLAPFRTPVLIACCVFKFQILRFRLFMSMIAFQSKQCRISSTLPLKWVISWKFFRGKLHRYPVACIACLWKNIPE